MIIKHVLIIRFRRIGDSILALTLFHSLRKMFPNAQLDFVLNKEIASLYKDHPDIDKIITFDKEEDQQLGRFLKKTYRIMHETHYDVIIDMRTTIKTLFFSLFSLSTTYRIGTKKWYSKFLHNYQIDNLNSNERDKIQENLLLLTPLAKETPLQLIPEFNLHISEEENQNFQKYMTSQGIDFNRPVILAAVTARLSNKVWPKERTKEILWRIIHKYDAQIIFNFGANEKEIAQALHQEMNNTPNIFIHIEAKNLRELCALAKNCHFFYGNEGGPRHLSQSYQIPSFAIYSPGITKTRWLPNACKRYQGICIEDVSSVEQRKGLTHAQLFALISVEDVWERVDKMLEDYLPRRN